MNKYGRLYRFPLATILNENLEYLDFYFDEVRRSSSSKNRASEGFLLLTNVSGKPDESSSCSCYSPKEAGDY